MKKVNKLMILTLIPALLFSTGCAESEVYENHYISIIQEDDSITTRRVEFR